MRTYEIEILKCVENHKPVSQKNISILLEVSQSNLAPMIMILEEKGFLIKEKIKKKGYKQNYYSLSDKGRRVLYYINEIRRLNETFEVQER